MKPQTAIFSFSSLVRHVAHAIRGSFESPTREPHALCVPRNEPHRRGSAWAGRAGKKRRTLNIPVKFFKIHQHRRPRNLRGVALCGLAPSGVPGSTGGVLSQSEGASLVYRHRRRYPSFWMLFIWEQTTRPSASSWVCVNANGTRSGSPRSTAFILNEAQVLNIHATV